MDDRRAAGEIAPALPPAPAPAGPRNVERYFLRQLLSRLKVYVRRIR